MDNRSRRLVPNSPAPPSSIFPGGRERSSALHRELMHPVEPELYETSLVIKDPRPRIFLSTILTEIVEWSCVVPES